MSFDTTTCVLTSFVVGVFTGITGFRLLRRGIQTSVAKANSTIVDKPLSYSNVDMKLVIAVRTDLGMGKGKIAAQCSHAAVGCYKLAVKKYPDYLKQWERLGQTKIVVKVDNGEEGLEELARIASQKNIPFKIIHDAGRTQIAAGSSTVVGVGPAPADYVNEVTGHLKLM